MAYGYDLFGWYIGVTEDDRRRSTRVVPQNTSLTSIPGELRSNWNGRTWVELPYKYVDPPVAIEQPRLEVGPLELKKLFTKKERIAVYGLKSTDPEIEDFLSFIDDLRLEVVDLNDAVIIEGIEYAINAIKTRVQPIYDQATADARIERIKSGLRPL